MEWIKLNKKLPKLDEVVILWQENPKAKDTDKEEGWAETGFLQSKKETAQGFYYEFMDSKYMELFNVTHWQPLPKAPK